MQKIQYKQPPTLLKKLDLDQNSWGNHDLSKPEILLDHFLKLIFLKTKNQGKELLDQKTKNQEFNLMNPISIPMTRCSILMI